VQTLLLRIVGRPDVFSGTVCAFGSLCRRLLIAEFVHVACMELVEGDDVLRLGVAAYPRERSGRLPGIPDPAHRDALVASVSHARI
jgi:hypothetical protein